MQRLAKEVLPAGVTYEWSGTSLDEIEAGGTTLILFGLGVLLVFLVLAAQYDSLVDPLIVILAVPLAILGALFALALRGLDDDIFAQVGFLMLVGLAAKNAILIVEFANQLRRRGMPIVHAAIGSAKARLRPILMTSFAFIFGVLPLVFAGGAGAASRHSLGTAVIGGMVLSTVLNLFVTPLLYVVIASLDNRYHMRGKPRPVKRLADLALSSDE